MVNNISKMFEELAEAKLDYVSALGRKSGVAAAKNRLMNLLFNYYDDLVYLVEDNKRLTEENESLNAALQEADEELSKVEAELKKLQKKKTPALPVEE